MRTLNFIKGIFFLTLVLLTVSLFAQGNDTILLKGTIIDDEGLPVPDVTILESGTTNGTTTNLNGYFELKILKGANVYISSVMMKPYKVENVNFSNIKVNLSNGLIEFCCITHVPSHCALTIREMQELFKTHKCSFK